MSDAALPTFIGTHAGGITLAVRVQPRASANAVGGEHNGELRVKVTAPPVDAAANEAVVRLIAETLDCPKSAIGIIRGHTARSKVLLVRGVSAADAANRLGAASERRRPGSRVR